jgi:CheY-like chemotaxis protein
MPLDAMSPEALLEGRRVLVVEDEPFIAFDIADAIENAGGQVVGPAASVAEALSLLEEEPVEAAILDVNLPDGDVGPVIASLFGRSAALVVHTGAGLVPDLAIRYPSLRVFMKPTPPPVLASALAASLASA